MKDLFFRVLKQRVSKRMKKPVTKEQIMQTATKYFSKNNALCVLAPPKYLLEADLLK